jgi:pimeloyl-ACP methyl ester carboxylesterase
MISQHPGSQLFYQQTGHGSKILLLFHGFGQDHKAFIPLAENLGDHFTTYTFDLYFHGQSTWENPDTPLTKQQWKKIMQQFLEEKGINTFALGGFSLGGKFALATAEAFPEKVSSLILIAPDGIKTNFWYSLATYPFLLRKLFRRIIKHPGIFFSLVRFFQSTGLVDKGLLRFAESQMNTEEKRRRVYHAWVALRKLQFDLRALASLINRHQIKTLVISGKFDKVIRTENLTRLSKHLDAPKTFVLESGHNHLIQHPEVVKIVLQEIEC